MSIETLTGQQIADAGLDGWAVLLYYGQGGLQTRIHTKSFSAGLQVVTAIGTAVEEMHHHAELDLRPSRVDVRLTSRDDGGVTERDLLLARRISEIAATAGAELECRSVSRLELGLDTPQHEKIAPFWAAVLDRHHVIGTEEWDDVGDPNHALPLIYFQRSGNEEPRQRWHLDVWIDPAQVQSRIDAALAAGGALVSEQPPTSWVLSDPDGNKIRLCTWQPGDTVLCDSQYRPGGFAQTCD